MKIVISPAKSLNLEVSIPPFAQASLPYFEKEAAKINNILKKKSVEKLGELMNLSENLSKLNWERNQAFLPEANNKQAKQAAYIFNGDVYTGLDIASFNAEELSDLQSKLFILSGLYGVLKPLDKIQAYRLEMGTKLRIGNKKDLVDFWKPKTTQYLNQELQEGSLLINLASNEYFKSIDSKKVKGTTITPQFKEFKNGTYKMISFFAKKARGMMVHYIVKNKITTANDLLGFDYSGYFYSEEQTNDNKSPVFIRNTQP